MPTTTPGRSALRVTPCTAATVPIVLCEAGQRASPATTVVTASGGGCQLAPCAIAAWIWKNFTAPIATMNKPIADSMMIIRFFMMNSSLTRPSDIDAAVFDEGAGRTRHLGAGGAVVGESRDLVELGAREIDLPRQHQEVGGEPGRVPVALGGELDLGGLAPRARRLDPLSGGLELGRGIQHLGANPLARLFQRDLGLALSAARDRGLGPRGPVDHRQLEHERDAHRVEVVVTDHPERAAEATVERRRYRAGRAS